jgi:cell division transport system permease protein
VGRVGFIFREALRSTRRSAAPSFAAMVTVLVTMLVIGIFIPIVQATTGAANDVRKRVLVDVFMKTTAKPADVARVRAAIQKTPRVGKLVYVSRAQAYAQQKKEHPALYDLLGANPLPDTFRITPDDPGNALALKSALPHDPAIGSVKNRDSDTKRILSITRVVKLTMAALAAILALASVLLIANTLRLSMFARRREVEVMKLVGATDWFIRWPFVFEGLLVGAAGAVLAIILLGVAKVVLVDSFFDSLPLLAAPQTLPFGRLVLIIVLSGMAVSALGSGLSLRRFLRV